MKTDLQLYIENQLVKNSQFNWQQVGGGSINNAYKISDESHTFFVKTNTTKVFKNGFKEEVLGLQFLEQNTALTPKIILEGIIDNNAFLVLEWIEKGIETAQFWKNFAHQLAELHKQKSEKFGLNYSNFIGELVQKNSLKNNFSEFFIENRLKPQVKLAFDDGLLQKNHVLKFENLYKKLPEIFPKENPCAVHGDLWSGNFICSTLEKAVFIDPAVYYGHREVDLAMSTLFGGFSQLFYQTYNEIYPLENGLENRIGYYNLYPLLIHLNLFGSSYLGSITRVINHF